MSWLRLPHAYDYEDAPITSLNLLDKVQRRLQNLIGDNLFSKLQPLSHLCDVASLFLFIAIFMDIA